MAKRILIVVGSMREQSFNKQLAKKAEEKIAERAEVSWLDYADIPYMNQDIEFPAPKQIEYVRKEVESADGIWFFTPEYNHSYPGVLKNLLDWLSRPLVQGDVTRKTAISGKKATLSGVGGQSATSEVRRKLEELLRFMGVELLSEKQTGIALGKEGFSNNILNLSEKEDGDLTAQVEEFLKFI